MLVTTTHSVAGKPVLVYKGLVAGEDILGANAVIGVEIDYETGGTNGSMLMVTAAGTVVRIE
jgi:uncharacterized protein YbjQ (UPF0145 family)